MTRAVQFGLLVITIAFETGCHSLYEPQELKPSDRETTTQDLTLAVSNLTVTDPLSINNIVIFCGMPGTGKTTLLNSTIGKSLFPSGPTTANVLTTQDQEYIYDDTQYIDLVGLTAGSIAQQAIKIARILQSNPGCNVVVVLTLEAGRPRENDVLLINGLVKLVQDISASGPLPYHLVINKLTNPVKEKLGDKLTLPALLVEPVSTTLIDFIPEIHDAENKLLPAGANLTKLVALVRPSAIPQPLIPYATTFSDLVVRFIAKHEGCKLNAYKDIAGHPTIGYGHLIQPDEKMKDEITQQEAEELLRKDIQTRSAHFVYTYTKNVNLYQPELDSFTSFTFNLGSGNFQGSTLLKRTKEGYHRGTREQKEEVWKQFCVWNKARIGGELKPVSGLTNRRKREAYLFFYGNTDPSIYDFDWNKEYEFKG